MARLLLTCLCVMALGQTATATVITFTNRADWQTAVGLSTVITETFDGGPIEPIPEGVLTDLGLLNVIYENATNTTKPRNRLNVGASSRVQLRWDRETASPTESLMLTFDAPMGAFGANFRSVDDGDGLSIAVNGDVIDIDARNRSHPV